MLLVLATLFALLGARSTFAAAPVISNVPSSINTDTEFSISVSFTGLSDNTTYRLRLALAPTESSSYFGSTFNGSSWYNGTPSPINYANFLSITTDGNGAWSGSLQGKVESSDSNFSGSSGTYDLKVGRYTATGTSATWSNIIQTTVSSLSSPTPTPTPSSTPTPAPSSTSTSSSSSSSFTVSNTPSQIDSTEEFKVSVNLSLSSSPNTTFYLKGAFKKKDGSNYFGMTKFGNSWIKNNQTYSNQFKITTDSSGGWNGDLELQPDILDSGYDGAGDYIFKVGRYAESGSLSWSNEVTIRINAQSIILDSDDDKDDKEVLGITEAKDKEPSVQPSNSKEGLSLEKYLKVSTPCI